MAEDPEWTSPRQRGPTADGPSKLRFQQLRQQFETPQVQTTRQMAPPPRRQNVKELRKKFERAPSEASSSQQPPHHDETEYVSVDNLKTIVEHRQRDVACLKSEIQELEELVDDFFQFLSVADVSSDRLSESGGSSMRDPELSCSFGTLPSGPMDDSLAEDVNIYEADAENWYDSELSDTWEDDDVFYPGGSPRGFKYYNPEAARKYEKIATGRPFSEPTEILNYPGMSHRKPARSQPSRKLPKDHLPWPFRGTDYGLNIIRSLILPHERGTYDSESSGKGSYTASWTSSKEASTAEGQSGKGSYTSEPSRKGSYTAELPSKGTYTAEPPRKGTYNAEPPRKGTYTAEPSRKGTYTASPSSPITFQGPMTKSANDSYELGEIYMADMADYSYEARDPEGIFPPRRNEEELEDDVFYEGGSPRGFKHQYLYPDARYKAAATGRRISEPTEVLNYPGTSHRKPARSQPSRELEKSPDPWPLRGRKETYVAGPSGKGTYTAGPSGKGTYTAGPSRKGTYTAGPPRKGTYIAEPSRKGTYTAGPSRKGTYTAGPSRKGTYTASPSTTRAKKQPTNDGTVKVEPHTPYSRVSRFETGQGGNTFQKTITLRSPHKKDPEQFNISIEPRDISQSPSGEHVVCDIGIEMSPPVKFTALWGEAPPITPSKQRKQSISTPTSVFTKHHATVRNLFDAERESPEYHSPLDNTIEWETEPMDRTFEKSPKNSAMNRTFEVSPENSPMNAAFSPDKSQEDDEFSPDYASSPQFQGNSTFSNSPQSQGNRTFSDSPQFQGNSTFSESPQSPGGNSTFSASPQFQGGNSTFSESPQSQGGNRTFSDSPQSQGGNRTFSDSPQSPGGNRTFSSSTPPPIIRLNDETLQDSSQSKNVTFEASPHDTAFYDSEEESSLGSSLEDSPKWKQKSTSQSGDEDETETNQLNTTF